MNILIVEDNQADQRILREAFRMVSSSDVSLTFFEDGPGALDYLERCPLLPSIMLLDLNLPGMHGKEVISAVRKSAPLCNLPVLILTSSESEEDVQQCYQLKANSYHLKPPKFSELLSLIRAINEYWLTHVVLPKH